MEPIIQAFKNKIRIFTLLGFLNSFLFWYFIQQKQIFFVIFSLVLVILLAYFTLIYQKYLSIAYHIKKITSSFDQSNHS